VNEVFVYSDLVAGLAVFRRLPKAPKGRSRATTSPNDIVAASWPRGLAALAHGSE
jgi:hypothetical protein